MKYFHKEDKMCFSGFKNKLILYLYSTISRAVSGRRNANISFCDENDLKL